MLMRSNLESDAYLIGYLIRAAPPAFAIDAFIAEYVSAGPTINVDSIQSSLHLVLEGEEERGLVVPCKLCKWSLLAQLFELRLPLSSPIGPIYIFAFVFIGFVFVEIDPMRVTKDDKCGHLRHSQVRARNIRHILKIPLRSGTSSLYTLCHNANSRSTHIVTAAWIIAAA